MDKVFKDEGAKRRARRLAIPGEDDMTDREIPMTEEEAFELIAPLASALGRLLFHRLERASRAPSKPAALAH